MKGTQKRKYIHAVQLTTSNESLPGGVCKSPLYWKSKIRGKRGGVSYLFFTPFPRTPAGDHTDSGMSRPRGETSTQGSASTLNGITWHCAKYLLRISA